MLLEVASGLMEAAPSCSLVSAILLGWFLRNLSASWQDRNFLQQELILSETKLKSFEHARHAAKPNIVEQSNMIEVSFVLLAASVDCCGKAQHAGVCIARRGACVYPICSCCNYLQYKQSTYSCVKHPLTDMKT